MLRIAVAMTVALSCVGAAFAQSISERSATVSVEAFVQAFIGHCAQNAGNTDRIIAAAESLGYPDLPKEMHVLVAPQDPKADFQGFMVLEGEGSPYMLGISRGQLEGRTYATCTVANPYIESTRIAATLVQFLSLEGPNHDERSAGQRYRVWIDDNIAPGTLISLTDAEPMGMTGATLALSAPISQ